jgi:hypothetical protein
MYSEQENVIKNGPFKGHCLHLTSILKIEAASTSCMSAILARSTQFEN